MRAQVGTYGGGRYVQHWWLEVDGVFIADTSVPEHVELFERIAARCNDDDPALQQMRDG